MGPVGERTTFCELGGIADRTLMFRLGRHCFEVYEMVGCMSRTNIDIDDEACAGDHAPVPAI